MATLMPFTCTFCGVYLLSFGRLQQHKYRHKLKYIRRTNERTRMDQYRYLCCEENFADDLKILKTGIRSQPHTKENLYQCVYFQKCFAKNGHLENHCKTHTKEKRYQCGHCQKSFLRKCDLRRHSRTHTKEKPYQCERCQKRFAQKGDLQRHNRSHTKGIHGIKPVRLNGSFDSKCTRPETSHSYQSFTILINTFTGIIVYWHNLRFKWHNYSRHQTVK